MNERCSENVKTRSIRAKICNSRKGRAPWRTWPSFIRLQTSCSLEQVPEELVVDFVVELHFRRLHERAQQPRAAVGRGLLQVRVAALHILAEQLRGPLRFAEVRQRVVDVVRQVAFGLAQVLDLRGVAVEPGLEDRVASPCTDSRPAPPSALPRACSSRCRSECESSSRDRRPRP